MITVHDRSGMKHSLASSAIARISPTEASSRWHGIRSVVVLHGGHMIESSDEVEAINKQIENERVRTGLVTLNRHQIAEVLQLLTDDAHVVDVSLENRVDGTVAAYFWFDGKARHAINVTLDKGGE